MKVEEREKGADANALDTASCFPKKNKHDYPFFQPNIKKFCTEKQPKVVSRLAHLQLFCVL
jgi:hypothetical protein